MQGRSKKTGADAVAEVTPHRPASSGGRPPVRFIRHPPGGRRQFDN